MFVFIHVYYYTFIYMLIEKSNAVKYAVIKKMYIANVIVMKYNPM